MKILVSDMGGVLYSFDRFFDQVKHQENFDNAIKKQGKSDTDLKSQLEAEYIAVQNGDLIPYPVKNGIDNLINNLNSCRVIIVSTSLVKTSKYILNKYGLKTDKIDFFDMTDYGNKKDKEAWKKIFQRYPSIDFIVEDGEKNLEVANQAAQELGFKPKIFPAMPVI